MTTRTEQLEEATRIRPSATAIGELRAECELREEMGGTHKERMATGALRILLDMFDKLPPKIAVHAVTPIVETNKNAPISKAA